MMPQLWRTFRVAFGFHQDTAASATGSATQVQHSLERVDTSLAAIMDYATAARDGGDLTQTAASEILDAVADMQSSMDTPAPARSQAMTLCLVSFEKPPRGESPPIEDLDSLRRDGISHTKMAELYGVGLRTVSRWHENLGCRKRIREGSEDVDGARRAMQDVMGGIGLTWGRRLWMGYLCSLGYRVRDRTIRSLLRELNPHGNAIRLQRKLVRRVYRVRGPNALWHVDGNHKLKPWGFFIHGAIDGGTRFLLYLYLSTRNTSTTALAPYKAACARHQGCSRVRIDAGSENYGIANFQLAVRGRNRGSVLVGPSVHNQPIERIWRDVRESVLDRFRSGNLSTAYDLPLSSCKCRCIFIQMESPMRIWNGTNSLDHHCLIAVFEGVIQESLNTFLDGWNHHHVPHRGIPAQSYAPCCRWDQLDDTSWAELASAGYTQVIDDVSDLGLIDYNTTGTATVPNDAVARSEVASHTVQDAAEKMRVVAQDLGSLHVGSTDVEMIQFYLTYRALVMMTSNLSDWP